MPSEPIRVELVAHDPRWANIAATEVRRLAAAIGDNLLVVQHIGSTAIPAIRAKPTIDPQPIVRRLDAVADAVNALGYDWRGEFGLTGRRLFAMTEDGRRLFHVHAYAEGSGEILQRLAFRDYLRAHPGEALAYEAQKLRVAALRPDVTQA